MLYLIGGVVAVASFGIGLVLTLGWINFTAKNREIKDNSFGNEIDRLSKEMDEYESRNRVQDNRNNRGFRRIDP